MEYIHKTKMEIKHIIWKQNKQKTSIVNNILFFFFSFFASTCVSDFACV